MKSNTSAKFNKIFETDYNGSKCPCIRSQATYCTSTLIHVAITPIRFRYKRKTEHPY